MHVAYESHDFDGTLPLVVTIDQYSNTKFTLCGRPYYTSEYLSDKAAINQGHNFVLKLYITVGKVNIDNTCKEVQEQYIVRFDNNDRRHLGVSENGFLTIEKTGV